MKLHVASNFTLPGEAVTQTSPSSVFGVPETLSLRHLSMNDLAWILSPSWLGNLTTM